ADELPAAVCLTLPQANQSAVCVIKLGVAPNLIDLAVLENPGAFGRDCRAEQFDVRIFGPAWLWPIFECGRRRCRDQRDCCSDERPSHSAYFSALTAASVLETCSAKLRSSWTIATWPSLPMT